MLSPVQLSSPRRGLWFEASVRTPIPRQLSTLMSDYPFNLRTKPHCTIRSLRQVCRHAKIPRVRVKVHRSPNPKPIRQYTGIKSLPTKMRSHKAHSAPPRFTPSRQRQGIARVTPMITDNGNHHQLLSKLTISNNSNQGNLIEQRILNGIRHMCHGKIIHALVLRQWYAYPTP